MAGFSGLAIFLASLCISGLSLAWAAKWSYEGAAGPLHWHELFPHACSGRKQSPIDIKAEQTVYNPGLKDFAIWYDPPKPGSKMFARNNGHTVQVDLEGEFYVSNGGLSHVYKAAQFHFHWGHKVHVGSEHLMESQHSPIEMHLVTYNQELFSDLGSAATEKGGLAVLGVMFEQTHEDNPALEPIVKAIKHIRDPETRTRIALPLISLRDLMPQDMSRYFRYNGSLTTPGCFESVTWTVFDAKQTISHRQMKAFRSLLQFRRHHRQEGRHKRSLSPEQRRMERAAEDVLEELGIKGDQYQEGVLKAELTQKTMENMFSDMPGAESAVTKPDHHKGGPNVGHHSEGRAETKYSGVDPTRPTMILEEAIVEQKFTQDILVNNYRPVQPLNDRHVERSFKLRPDPKQMGSQHDGAGADCPEVSEVSADQHHHHQERGDNSAGRIGGKGLVVVYCSLLIAVWTNYLR